MVYPSSVLLQALGSLARVRDFVVVFRGFCMCSDSMYVWNHEHKKIAFGQWNESYDFKST